MGYRGEVRRESAFLADVLTASMAPSGPDVGYVIAAGDGFRAMISSSELFSAVQPLRVLVVDRYNGPPLKEQGSFKLIVANETITERWVASVAKVNEVHAAPRDMHRLKIE